MMKNSLVYVVLLLFLILLLCGCLNFKRDVTHNKQFLGGYELDKEYRITRDLFLEWSNSGLSGKRLILIPEESYKGRSIGRHESAPYSIDAFLKDPINSTLVIFTNFNYTLPVVGIVKNGTIIKLSRLERNYGLNLFYLTHDDITPFAIILDGKFVGKEVDITDISIYYREEEKGTFVYLPEEGLISVI
jgi:hypothetical protein